MELKQLLADKASEYASLTAQEEIIKAKKKELKAQVNKLTRELGRQQKLFESMK